MSKILKKYSRINILISAWLVLFICFFCVNSVSAQKKPTEFDSRLDDKQLCNAGDLASTEYCDFWKIYTENRTKTDDASQAIAKDARNELIKYVQGRVDRFYEESINKKKFNRNLLQTILDILEIGAATSIGISRGERAKEVIGIALAGLQATRTSLNKNFDLLQTRILINKIRENRAKILTSIVANMSKSVSEYSWLDAKNDLRQYLFAGSLSNALDSLAADTGDAAQNAEESLRTVSGKITIVSEATKTELMENRAVQQGLIELGKKLDVNTTKMAALDTLKDILKQLQKDSDLKPFVGDESKAEPTDDGKVIIARIIEIRREVGRKGSKALLHKINEIIIQVSKIQ